MSWIYLTAAIFCEVSGTTFLRMSDGFRRKKWIAPFALLQGVSFLFLFLSLGEGMPIGVAYGIWAAVGIALTAVVAHLLFRDPLTRRMGLGIAVIAAGVLVIELGH
ncbi:DMT family transporter [Streptomyces anulatus]